MPCFYTGKNKRNHIISSHNHGPIRVVALPSQSEWVRGESGTVFVSSDTLGGVLLLCAFYLRANSSLGDSLKHSSIALILEVMTMIVFCFFLEATVRV